MNHNSAGSVVYSATREARLGTAGLRLAGGSVYDWEHEAVQPDCSDWSRLETRSTGLGQYDAEEIGFSGCDLPFIVVHRLRGPDGKVYLFLLRYRTRGQPALRAAAVSPNGFGGSEAVERCDIDYPIDGSEDQARSIFEELYYGSSWNKLEITGGATSGDERSFSFTVRVDGTVAKFTGTLGGIAAGHELSVVMRGHVGN